MPGFMNGVVTHEWADPALLREAGIGWVREGVPYPFVDRLGGTLSRGYEKASEMIGRYASAGIKVMASTLQPGSALWEPDASGKLVSVWHNRYPKWYGALGTEDFLRNFEETARWLAKDLKGQVQAWQIANELDIGQFAGPLNPRQACELILRGARGIKKEDPGAVVGHNVAGAHEAYFFLGHLFPPGGSDLISYCGVDGYYGSWSPGSPDDWAARVRELHALTGAPVILNEWGFASAGGVLTDEERRSGVSVCQSRKWPYSWGKGHTPEGQAEFITRALQALASLRDEGKLLGQFYFRWADQKTCWQCGQPGCPAETAWGLVDLEGKPKPSYRGFQEALLGK